MRIVFLGDSLTWGGYGGNFVDEVAAMLGDEHTIINQGVGGDTVVNLLNRLDKVLAEKPDGVFVMVGGNDAISYTQPDTQRYYRRSKDIKPDGIVTPEIFAQTYRDLLTRLQLAHIIVWVGLPPNEYTPEMVAAQQQYNDIAADIARSLNIPVIDFMPHFPAQNLQQRPPLSLDTIRLIGQREADGWDDYEGERQRLGYNFTFDGLHLTPDTATRMADLIVEFLNL